MTVQAKAAGPIGGEFTLDDPSEIFNFKKNNITRLFITLNLKTDQVPISCSPGDQILVVSRSGSIRGAGKILRFDAKSGAFFDEFLSNCLDVDSFGNCASVPGATENPVDMIYGPDQKLYIADTPIGSFGFNATGIAIKRYNGINGSYEDYLDPFSNFIRYGDGGLSGIGGIAFGPDSNLFISDSINGVILRYDGQTGEFIDTYASNKKLQAPGNIQFGPDGNLYVLDTHNNQILRFQGPFGINPGAKMDDLVIFDNSETLIAATFGADGLLYVSSGDWPNYSIRRYQGPFGINQGEFIDAFELPEGSILSTGLAFGPDGNLYASTIGVKGGILGFSPETKKFIGRLVKDPNPGAILFSSVPEKIALGDFNNDGCIDKTGDLMVLMSAIRSKSSDKKFDLNKDGSINIADARKLLLLFSQPGGGIVNKIKLRTIMEHVTEQD